MLTYTDVNIVSCFVSVNLKATLCVYTYIFRINMLELLPANHKTKAKFALDHMFFLSRINVLHCLKTVYHTVPACIESPPLGNGDSNHYVRLSEDSNGVILQNG